MNIKYTHGQFLSFSITIEKILRESTAQISIEVRGEVGRALCASDKLNQVEVSPLFQRRLGSLGTATFSGPLQGHHLSLLL